MTSLVTIFIAIEPDAAIYDLISGFKSTVRGNIGEQMYLEHPPHLTLYQAVFERERILEVSQAIRELSCQACAPCLEVSGWHSFLDDPLTGGNTLVCDIVESNLAYLRELQGLVVSAIASLRDVAATNERLAGRLSSLSESQQQCARETGFPYLGDGWHPHFTIASVAPSSWAWVRNELLAHPPKLNGSCKNLNVYSLENGVVKLLFSFPIQGAGCGASGLRDRHCIESGERCVSVGNGGGGSRAAGGQLKHQVMCALARVVERIPWISSSTLTGSFVDSEGLEGISDVDFIVIAKRLTKSHFDELVSVANEELRPVADKAGFSLMINSTLGPLKFDGDDVLVLHLMLYSEPSHIEHAIKSPFTCFDWQRTKHFYRKRISDIYPVFGLQPRHFVGARRSVTDYLRDYKRRKVSYRTLQFDETGYCEVPCEKPMSVRDEHEFAFHILKFLMRNLFKLINRTNEIPEEGKLLSSYFSVFPKNENGVRALYSELSHRKSHRDFSEPVNNLAERLEQFVSDFEMQFCDAFQANATRHLFVRHARTCFNQGAGEGTLFLGRTDASILSQDSSELSDMLIEELKSLSPKSVFSSPLARCRQSLSVMRQRVLLPFETVDDRLIEMDYGRCEGMSVREARVEYPELFEGWSAGDDPKFPSGENTSAVCSRLQSFLSDVLSKSAPSLVCTHNVILRCMIGMALNVPKLLWHKLRIPHLQPISVINSRFGWFVEFGESLEREIFSDFMATRQSETDEQCSVGVMSNAKSAA